MFIYELLVRTGHWILYADLLGKIHPDECILMIFFFFFSKRETVLKKLPKQQLKVYKEETPPAPQLEQISCQEWRV